MNYKIEDSVTITNGVLRGYVGTVQNIDTLNGVTEIRLDDTCYICILSEMVTKF